MTKTLLSPFEATFFSPDRRVATAARAALFVAVLVVAIAGPLYGVAALIGALLMLRDLRYGLWVGMYRPSDGARLDVTGPTERIRDRGLRLADVEVTP